MSTIIRVCIINTVLGLGMRELPDDELQKIQACNKREWL